MLHSTFVHWKTTLAGASAAAFQVIAHGTNWKSLAMAAAIAFLGALAKDGEKQ